MTLVASTGTKTSMPAKLMVQVLPVNDEVPHLINNTGLEVWAGAITPITNRNLGNFHTRLLLLTNETTITLNTSFRCDFLSTPLGGQ